MSKTEKVEIVRLKIYLKELEGKHNKLVELFQQAGSTIALLMSKLEVTLDELQKLQFRMSVSPENLPLVEKEKIDFDFDPKSIDAKAKFSLISKIQKDMKEAQKETSEPPTK